MRPPTDGPPQPRRRRSRLVYALAACAVVALGLASRRYRTALDPIVGEYAGDTLWALLVFLGLGFLWPAASTLRLAAGAGLFALGIELSQLYHAPWIDAVRATRLGGLVLGFGFLASDLVCYTAGIAFGASLDRLARRWPAGPAPVPGRTEDLAEASTRPPAG